MSFSDPEAAPEALLDPLGCARAFLRANGVGPERIRCLTSDRPEAIAEFRYDLVVSMRSWAYLYPLSTYLDVVLAALKPGGVLILDVAKERGGIAHLKDHVANATRIRDLADLERCLVIKDAD